MHDTELLQQRERIEVVVAVPRSPVQTGRCLTSAMQARHPADRFSRDNGSPRWQPPCHGLIFGADAVRMGKHDDAPINDATSKDDPARAGSPNHTARSGEVNPAVSRAVPRRRSLKCA
jgi:hypothetical protein